MVKKEGAKPKLLRYLKKHVGEKISRDKLAEVANYVGSWERSLRSLRDEGYIIDYDSSTKTYQFPYSEPQNEPKGPRRVNNKLRALVIIRDNSTCQMCGKNVQQDKIKIHIDHIVPYDWGGPTQLENLQCLCSTCNEGKKNFVENENPTLMKNIAAAPNAMERLRLYFDFYPNKELDVDKLSVIAKTRDWTRTIRSLNSKYDMNIKPRRKKKGIRSKDCYIYLKNK